MTQENESILLYDSKASFARLYKEELEKEGHQVISLTNRDDIISFLNDNIRTLVIDLPPTTEEATRFINTLKKRNKNIPVITTSSHGSVTMAVAVMRCGVQDFLVKPFNPQLLLNAVGNISKTGKEEKTLSFPVAGIQPEEQDGEQYEELEKDQWKQNLPKSTIAATPVRTIPVQEERTFGGFIGTSPQMLSLYNHIEKAASSHATVFITGESGTGKEVCAEAIHKHSPRKNGPFIPINCAAIPRDLMESELFGHVKGAFTGAIADREGAAKLADGGTLFLDEIAEMRPDMQTKLLRFLQNLHFQKVGGSKTEKTDIRIICATNRHPVTEIEKGNFREDLFYRLYVLPIHMPPLRERGNDVIDIAETLLKKYAAEENKSFRTLSPALEDILVSHDWPGNIRQLQNVLRHAVVMNDGEVLAEAMIVNTLAHNTSERKPVNYNGKRLEKALFPPLAEQNATIKPLADIERDIIEKAITACHGNIPKAAAMLEISPSTIYRKKTGWDEDEALVIKDNDFSLEFSPRSA